MGGALGVLIVPIAVVVMFALAFVLIGRRRPRAIALKGAVAFVMGALPAAGISAMLLGERLDEYWFAVPLAGMLGGAVLCWPVVRRPASH